MLNLKLTTQYQIRILILDIESNNEGSEIDHLVHGSLTQKPMMLLSIGSY